MDRLDPLAIAAALAERPPVQRRAGGMSIGTTDDGRIVRWPFGESPETQKLMTIQAPDGGGFTNVPTIYGGVPVSEAEAIAMALRGYDPDTGLGFQSFASRDAAVRDAKARSRARDPEMLRKFPFTFDDEGQPR